MGYVIGTVSETLLKIDGLNVRYGRRVAVDGVSFCVGGGEAVGLLGVNGAGKTSTLKAVLGMLRPTRGEISFLGQRPGSSKAFLELGFAPEEGTAPEHLSAREWLRFVGAFRISDKAKLRATVDDLLAWFDLRDESVRSYSKGMKKRLLLAQAFLGNPKFMILDEPLNGLDPLVIIKLRERLEKYCAEGGTLLYCSHILAEVEKVCGRIIILSGGKILCDAPVSELVKEFGSVETAFAKKVGPS